MKIEQLQKKIKDFEKSLKEQVNGFQSEIDLKVNIIIWECIRDDDKFFNVSVKVEL